MGIDIEGGMIVGRLGKDIECDHDDGLTELAEENGMDNYSLHYDADEDWHIYGFEVKDVLVDEIDEWVKTVKEKAQEFKNITGLDAKLFGSQNVW
jgi:hypothetical protein